MSLVIGTRGSDLALWQARWVAQRLGGDAAGIRLEVFKTQGDRTLDLDLAASADKGLFTRELEVALLERRIDVAVHSLKDLPTSLPEGLALGAVPERADVGDVLLVRPEALDRAAPWLPVRSGARLGTGSPRRQAGAAFLRPDLVTGLFRGNVPTRVDKCRRGEVDAVVVARAGLSRLRLDVAPLVALDLVPELWLPAPGQGALGLEVRADDERVRALLAPLHHEATGLAVAAERALLATLEAGCHAALGTFTAPRRRAEPTAGGVMIAGALQPTGPDGVARWCVVSAEGAWSDLAPAVAASLEGAPPASPSGAWVRPVMPW